MGRGSTRTLRFALALALVGVLAAIVVSAAAALRFNDTPCVEQGGGGIRLCPGGVVDGSYSVTLTGSGGCGPGLPYQYRVLNGALPPGLSLSSSGTISGKPTQAGTYDFWLEISDQNPPTASWCVVPVTAEHEFRITVSSALSITTKSLPQGASVGQPYSAPLEAMLLTSTSPPAGSVPANLAWSVASGTLPPGLAIVNGTLAGTPTTEGSYTFVVQATLDALRTDIETLTLVVRQPLAIQAAKPFALAGATTRWELGVPFTAKLTAGGGTGTYTWSLAAGALPPGITLAPDGTVGGNPTAAGAFRFTVGLADNEGRTASYSAIVSIAPRLAFKTLLLRPAKVGRLYQMSLKTTGGILPTKWKLTGRLPRGVRFASKLGVLSGTPKQAGRYRVTVEVTDALKVKTKKTFTLVVLP